MVIIRQIGYLQTLIKSTDAIRLISISGGKLYSVFAPSFKKPIFSKKEQAVLKEIGDAENLAHCNIRPALVDQTSSEFYDPIVNKFTNYIMRKGKKELARYLLERTFEKIKRTQLESYHKAQPENRSKIILNPTEILYNAIENVKPVMELRGITKGGTTYQVPIPILEKRQSFLAMNWLIKTAKDKSGEVPFYVVLARELIDASNNRGRVVKKKQDLHRQCEANRAYAHFRWV